MTSEKYLITLANSHFGTLAIETLLKEVPAKNIIATVRDLKKAKSSKKKVSKFVSQIIPNLKH